MTSLIIKLILWFPFFIVALLFGALGGLFFYLIPPLAFIPYKVSNFLMKLIINDMTRSIEGTPLKKYWEQFKQQQHCKCGQPKGGGYSCQRTDCNQNL